MSTALGAITHPSANRRQQLAFATVVGQRGCAGTGRVQRKTRKEYYLSKKNVVFEKMAKNLKCGDETTNE